jgi:hypothetical protein
MKRNGNHNDAVIDRELAAVDATLAGKPVAAEHDDLAELVRAIRAERPLSRPGFSVALDAQVRQGFRAPASAGAPRKPRRRPRLVPLAAGSAASLLIVVTAVLSSGVLSGGGESRHATPQPVPVSANESSPSAAAPQASPSGGSKAVTDQAAPAVSGGGLRAIAPNRRPTAKVLPQIRNRQVERDAALILASPPNKVEDTADGVIEVTDRYQGFVLRSNITGGDQKAAGATLDLRIPTDRLQPALRDLSALAHVRSRTQSSQDITGRFVSARSRLRDLTTERRSLLRQLARAATPDEAAIIRARLRQANRQIATARSNLRGLHNRVNFSSVAVTVDADDALPTGSGNWTPGDALHDAVGVLGVAAGVALISLAVLLPVAAISLLALLAYRRIIRGRRGRALDF